MFTNKKKTDKTAFSNFVNNRNKMRMLDTKNVDLFPVKEIVLVDIYDIFPSRDPVFYQRLFSSCIFKVEQRR